MEHYFRSTSESSWPVSQPIVIEWLLHIWQNSSHDSRFQELDFSHKKEAKRNGVGGRGIGHWADYQGRNTVIGFQGRNLTSHRIMQEYKWTS